MTQKNAAFILIFLYIFSTCVAEMCMAWYLLVYYHHFGVKLLKFDMSFIWEMNSIEATLKAIIPPAIFFAHPKFM